MGWIGLVFVLIIIFDWFKLRSLKASLKKKIIGLSITILLLILIELQYAFKETCNLYTILDYIENHIFMGLGRK
ncbi:hypothetical protein M3201_05540 [Paenibacillus motobuensis]|uniref:hypothetical protein n=1 Tax=Paenibacillus TaxID=44249 RepID=UPI00203F2F4C|nr:MULTISPECIES: hypothetical protein [Paenibacillus]MCM3039159.1 hypothetical protein [Paenibacillus lutimineralis]MCM3646263.1 hypothetical protein [Paenibacillus motobuensis]